MPAQEPANIASQAALVESSIHSSAKLPARKPADGPAIAPGYGTHLADILHRLANTSTAVLVNIQMLERKLTPYSRLKPLVRKVERQAQEHATLVEGLLSHFATNGLQPEVCETVPLFGGDMAAAGAQGLGATDEASAKLRARRPPSSAPDSAFPPEEELTLICDRCTSPFFPKEER